MDGNWEANVETTEVKIEDRTKNLPVFHWVYRGDEPSEILAVDIYAWPHQGYFTLHTRGGYSTPKRFDYEVLAVELNKIGLRQPTYLRSVEGDIVYLRNFFRRKEFSEFAEACERIETKWRGYSAGCCET